MQYMSGVNAIFYVIVLIMSVVVHEVAHGFAAESQGDPTARYAGRLTLNPLRHIDMVGSVLLPLFLVLTHAQFLIGWAKPVPYNERNLRDKKWGTVLVAGAGILANIVIAVVFGLAIRCAGFLGSFSGAFIFIASIIVWVNLILALFNLIPIPPLDGSKILFALMPERHLQSFQAKVEYLSLPLLIVFVLFLWPYIFPVVGHVFGFITGIPLSV